MGVNPTTYKNFITYKSNISKKDINIIQDSIAYINLIKNKALNYLDHRKPKSIQVKMFKL